MSDNHNVITNRNGQLSSATGELAVKAFAVRSLIVSLRTEAKLPKGAPLTVTELRFFGRVTGNWVGKKLADDVNAGRLSAAAGLLAALGA